jgi:MFS family permease
MWRLFSGLAMISGERPWLLMFVVSGAGILALLSFALWPVFLTRLGPAWGLNNADIGWVSGAYFAGYLLATPILVGLTDRVDARLVFLGGCGFSVAGCLLFALTAHDFWSASLAWAVVGSGLAGTYMPANIECALGRASSDPCGSVVYSLLWYRHRWVFCPDGLAFDGRRCAHRGLIVGWGRVDCRRGDIFLCQAECHCPWAGQPPQTAPA